MPLSVDNVTIGSALHYINHMKDEWFGVKVSDTNTIRATTGGGGRTVSVILVGYNNS